MHTVISVSFGVQVYSATNMSLNMLAVVMRAVYKDMLLLTFEDRFLDYGELRNRVSCICDTVCVYYR